ncbi:hypothetical protein C8R47DRAFT_1222673 [Mycena vitilis]|nr:hypothetical protein C8R47DRAFT_1222673 [Mycena vitilis]
MAATTSGLGSRTTRSRNPKPVHYDPQATPGRPQNEGSPWKAGHSTPENALVMSYGKPKLTDTQKQAVEDSMQAYKLHNRCLFTQEKDTEYCHLIDKATPSEEVSLLSEHWGLPQDGYFDVNSPENIVKMGPTEHYGMDQGRLVLIPEKDLTREITSAFQKASQERLPLKQNLFEFFSQPDPDGLPVRALPLEIDPKKALHRQLLLVEEHRGKDGKITKKTYSSSGSYERHDHPYSTLVSRTQAHPFCIIWHAGKALAHLPPSRLLEIEATLTADMGDLIANIMWLYDRWALPEDEQDLAQDEDNLDVESDEDASDCEETFNEAGDACPESDEVEPPRWPRSPPVFAGKHLTPTEQCTTETERAHHDVSQSDAFGPIPGDPATIRSTESAPANVDGEPSVLAPSYAPSGKPVKAKRKSPSLARSHKLSVELGLRLTPSLDSLGLGCSLELDKVFEDFGQI